MERRFRIRLDELLDDAEVPPGLMRGVLPRLEAFLRPFVRALRLPQQRTNARHYVQGLLSDLGGKDAESIAYLHDRDRQGLQKFIGQVGWDHRPLMTELAWQVGEELGEVDGVLVFDPSAFPKQGTESVGVQRQWCGRLGKLDNCQVGVYLGYVSRREHALVDVRLYLPKEWVHDRTRRQKAGVPKGVHFRTRHDNTLRQQSQSVHNPLALGNPDGPASATPSGLRAIPTPGPTRNVTTSAMSSGEPRRSSGAQLVKRRVDSAFALSAERVPNLGPDGSFRENRPFFAGSSILEREIRFLSFSAMIPWALFLPGGQDWFHHLARSAGQEFSCAARLNRQPTVFRRPPDEVRRRAAAGS
jgi:hypothetical protein